MDTPEMIVPRTTTFLSADNEGSTRWWEAPLQERSQALLQHDTLLRGVIETHAGRILETAGNSFCATFARTSDALRAALAIQQRISAWRGEMGGEALIPRVRIALHTGPVEKRDGDYLGPALKRVARLVSIGHDGQVLLSQAAHDGLADLPEGASLVDLGTYWLRDLREPERVWQLLHPDLPARFPPLLALNATLNNLPIQTTSFIGREKGIAAISQFLLDTRLLTLTGPGGCGKTRLMLQVAEEMIRGYRDGICLVQMAGLSDPALVPQSVANMLGVHEEPGTPWLETLRAHLREKRLLLLLDNCEHLLEGCARLVTTILRDCPEVTVLCTSRERLGIVGEVTYPVPFLTAPSAGSHPDPSVLLAFESVRLFQERAASSQPGFTVTAVNGAAVAEICRRLEGNALAIELAAARVRALPVAEINARLEKRFRPWTGNIAAIAVAPVDEQLEL